MRTLSQLAAALLLALFFALAFFSSWDDAAIFDESAHIGAGYSYITQKDMRLNPEHPPLMKDLAGIALLPLHPVYRTDTKEWQEGINEQWIQGTRFLHEWGNDADAILHYSRFPTILLALITGVILFLWTQRQFGSSTALLTLFFYTLSPTVIAHSRFVTTDIAATFGFLVGLITFLEFLKKPGVPTSILAALAFGIAQLLKFSLFLLVPIYIFLAIFWLAATGERKWQAIRKLFLKIVLIFIGGALLVWVIYAYHVWDYPQAKQLSDTKALIGGFKVKIIRNLDLWLVANRFTRPLGHYLMGLMMVSQRTAGGNAAYFLGQVSSKGWHYYFPTVYLLKETLAFHILTLLAFIIAMRRIIRAKEKSWFVSRRWLRNNFPLFASLFFVAFYWAYSMANPLNIGVRHVLPTFPFIYILVANTFVRWVRPAKPRQIASASDFFKAAYSHIISPLPKLFLVGLALLWIIASTISSYPYYLSYCNELVGSRNCHRYITDSNYDWGQDLKRLVSFAHEHSGEKIYLDYFGGSSPSYYLGGQYEPWWSQRGAPPSGSLFAVSVNSLEGSQAKAVGGFPELKPEDTYSWLRGFEPFTRAGTSIFIYRIP